jgi:hypothetical protein
MRYPTDINSNRIRGVVDNLIGTEDADDIMMELMNALSSDSTLVPDVGKYYVFVYRPKTPLIQYDQNPLVAVTDIFRWGFRGINYHWRQYRQYSWEEVVGSLYQIYPDELADARELPIQKFILNS